MHLHFWLALILLIDNHHHLQLCCLKYPISRWCAQIPFQRLFWLEAVQKQDHRHIRIFVIFCSWDGGDAGTVRKRTNAADTSVFLLSFAFPMILTLSKLFSPQLSVQSRLCLWALSPDDGCNVVNVHCNCPIFNMQAPRALKVPGMGNYPLRLF